ncbi:nuclear transport factor 2 family protein [Chryseolinea sp. H1M3-3]|uniref:nuclear transport factor 2 family protein n=1 Tax=Chryseolinea sp. H1M3-3 TaxID=3034144 RepID=UPI0023EABFED|nr:nuclear transport factor 2 family protein [Chryseolinea sp. H1M3-3]
MASEDSLIVFSHQWDEAMVRNNVSEIDQYMADDWVIVGTEGGITPKEIFLKSIETGDLVHTRMDADEIRVRIYDNTGVVTSRGTSSGTYKGQPFSFHEWQTSVFVWKQESWQCVHTMLTPAMK